MNSFAIGKLFFYSYFEYTLNNIFGIPYSHFLFRMFSPSLQNMTISGGFYFHSSICLANKPVDIGPTSSNSIGVSPIFNLSVNFFD